MIPPLIIQPFVENSILYGFTGCPNFEKRINILAVISGDRLNSVKLDCEYKITRERIALL